MNPFMLYYKKTNSSICVIYEIVLNCYATILSSFLSLSERFQHKRAKFSFQKNQGLTSNWVILFFYISIIFITGTMFMKLWVYSLSKVSCSKTNKKELSLPLNYYVSNWLLLELWKSFSISMFQKDDFLSQWHWRDDGGVSVGKWYSQIIKYGSKICIIDLLREEFIRNAINLCSQR